MLCAPNFEATSQEELTKRAIGVPQVEVSIVFAPERTLLGGFDARGQNQTEILVEVRSIAYLETYTKQWSETAKTRTTDHPPPFALKAGPNEFSRFDLTPHPLFLLATALQLVEVVELYYETYSANFHLRKDTTYPV